MDLIVFRTDASLQIGSGHVMRCISLAHDLQKKGAIIKFVTRKFVGNLDDLILKKGFEVLSLSAESIKFAENSNEKYANWLGVSQEQDALETINAIKNVYVDWIIVDHYAIDRKWEEKLSPYSKKIMVIDDLSNRRHHCDVLLDQNYINDISRYDNLVPKDTTKFLGPRYALLRKEFREENHKKPNNIDSVNSVFIFFGASDLHNLTSLSIKALTQKGLENLSVIVLVGSTNNHLNEIKKLVKARPNTELHIQVENVAKLMSLCDLAIGAGGSTTWERLAIGLPSIVVTVADNQVPFSKELDNDNYITYIGAHSQVTQKDIYKSLIQTLSSISELHEQSINGQILVNGKGVGILTDFLIFGDQKLSFTYRKACFSDCQIYWAWANETQTRKNAFNQDRIEWQNHKKWFRVKLSDPLALLLIFESNYGLIGQVRFEYENSEFNIDYSIDKQFRGYGLGKIVLTKSIQYLCNNQPKKFINLVANVKKNNKASISIFKKLGFKITKINESENMFSFSLKCSKNDFKFMSEDKLFDITKKIL